MVSLEDCLEAWFNVVFDFLFPLFNWNAMNLSKSDLIGSLDYSYFDYSNLICSNFDYNNFDWNMSNSLCGKISNNFYRNKRNNFDPLIYNSLDIFP